MQMYAPTQTPLEPRNLDGVYSDTFHRPFQQTTATVGGEGRKGEGRGCAS